MKKKLFGALAGASLVFGSLAIATPAANANADVPLDITALNLEGEYFSSWISGKCTNHSNLGSTVATMKSSLGTTVTSTLPPESDGSFEFFSQANTAIDVTVTCTNYKSQSVTSDALSLSKDKATKSQLKLSKSTVKVAVRPDRGWYRDRCCGWNLDPEVHGPRRQGNRQSCDCRCRR